MDTFQFGCVLLIQIYPFYSLYRITVDTSPDESGETVNVTLHFACAQVSDVGNYTCFAVVDSEGEVPITSRTVALDIGGMSYDFFIHAF